MTFHKGHLQRNAHILDLHLAGVSSRMIGEIKGLSRQRVREIIIMSKWRLARQVFRHVPRWYYRWDEDKQRYEALG